MKKFRFVSALLLAFGSLLFATPAMASDWQTSSGNVVNGSVQFDWRGGSAMQTLQEPEGSTLTITVNNTTANCIGNCVPRPDTWALTINGEEWSGNTIETVTITATVSGEVTLVASGKDEGFWGGWYGPIFSAPIITSPEPTPEPVETGTWEGQVFTATAPEGQIFTAVTGWYGAPTDPNCGADVSATLAQFLGGSTFSVGADNGVFGDPCGGVVKVLRVNLTATAVSPTPIETVEPAPTPLPTESPTVEPSLPTPEPIVEPLPEPVPLPSPSVDAVDPIAPELPPVVEPIVTPPVIEPAPQPQPIPFPVDPEPEPQPAPVEPTPDPISTPEPEPVEEPQILEPEPEPIADPVVAPNSAEETPAELPESQPGPIEVEPSETPVVKSVEEQSIAIVSKLENIAPKELTDAQVAQLEAAIMAVFETAEQGSPAYEQALEALSVLAQADDAELPAELAAIPLLGDAAGAALEVFNAIGNIGADMSPAVREQAEDAVVASVIVGQVASAAASAAVSTSAASTRKIK